MIEQLVDVTLRKENVKILKDLEIMMPCDVNNPLLGLKGASYVFGPQKGVKFDDLPYFDSQMERIIKFYVRAIHGDSLLDERFQQIIRTPGSGASGGLVACMLACFKKAHIVSGMDFVTQICDLEQ